MRKPLGDFAQCSPLQRTLMITLALTDTPALTSLEKLFAHHPIHSSSGTQVEFCPLPISWLQPPTWAAFPLLIFSCPQGSTLVL